MSDTPPAASPIVFGTDGWRARIGEDYTYDNVRRCAQGVAEWVIEQGTTSAGVVVGYDRRFSSEYFAVAAAEVLLAPRRGASRNRPPNWWSIGPDCLGPIALGGDKLRQQIVLPVRDCTRSG